MSKQLIQKLESYRKTNGLSTLALCNSMGIYPVTFRRWKKTGRITESYKKLIANFLSQNNPTQGNGQAYSSDIAVIGIACYYPGASNVKELWENILTRRVQFRRMLDQRLPLNKYYDSDSKALDKTYLTKAAFLENYQFDWGKLRIPKKTVESTDIAHWLALDIALKTFEDAGFKLNEIPLQNTGVIVGNTLTGEQTRSQTLRLRWPYVQKALNATLGYRGMGQEECGRIAGEMEQIFKSAFYPVTEDSLAGGLANTIAGRICNYMNLKGGGYIVDGACSSSLLAVATAANALKMGDMDLVLAGGVDISLDPFELVGFAKAGALARDKMSVYDQSANGFLPGEGCGFVLLKRLEDAIKDKNYVYAVIKGWGISSDGKGGIMEPSSSGQSFAIGRAYKNLPYKIADVDFVEGHGTGTTKGDRVELEGIETAIENSLSNKGKNLLRTCGVTSFKSIVGHTKAAAGVGGLIKAILAVNQRVLPPTASCTTPNEVFKDKAKHLYPLIQGRLLEQKKIARAGISSAGFGGINCHVTVESRDQAKPELKPKIDERALFVSQQTSEVFVFTSRTILHLKKVIVKFKEDLRNVSIAEMADLAALLNKKVKNRLPIKASIVTDTPEHLYDALVLLEQEIASVQIEEGQIHKIKANEINTHIALSNHAKEARVGFLYPGQGSQRLNMTRVLVERYKWAQDLFGLSKLPLYDHIYKATDKYFTKEEQEEFEERLADTRVTQPSIILSSLIWTEFLSKLGVEPVGVAGHSLGELTAFYRAGAFDKETLIKFAELRGQLMASPGRQAGGMVSLFCPRQKAEEYVSKISGNVILANINSPSQMIVSGGKREIEKVIELAQEEEVSTRRLNVSNAFHSLFMTSASQKIQSSKVLPDIFKPNGVKVYSGIDAQPIEYKLNMKEYFSKQVVSQVNFVGLVETISTVCDILIEVGPGRVLTDLVKAINKEHGPLCLPIESIAQNDRDLNIVLAEFFVRNVSIKWDELYRNRLIKVFVPASRKKFIENQCERPLKLGNQILKSESLQTSYTVESPEQAEQIIPGGLPAIEGKDNIADLLIDLTHKLTGFDKASIALDSKLLDDLNLDSIKAGELIGQAGRALGIAGQIDPSKFLNNTLSQIRDKLSDLVQDYGKAGLAVKESTADILRRYQDKPWVRNFVQNLIPQEITTRNVNQLHNLKNIVLLSDKGEDSLADAIKAHFKNGNVKVRKIHYEDMEAKTDKGNIDCLIRVFPRDTKFIELNKDTLKDIIKRLNKIVGLANSNQIAKDAVIVFVQFGGGNFGENDNLKNIASSSAKSLASTLYLERPHLKVRVIDFDNQVSDREVILKVTDELQTYEQFNAVGYDAELKRKVVNYDNSNPIQYKKRNISWSSKDVVLVTGGAKGITAQCALEFARATKANMVLMGRSPVSKDKNNEINQTLKQFEKENLQAIYYQCDVTDEKNVAQTIKEIEQNEGKITGLIHGAGLNSLKRLKQVSVTEALNESLPKVIGAVNVCKALSQPLKLIAAITSIIGVTGMEGSGWYGLANEVLNLYLHQFKAQYPKTEVVAIAYSIWDEVGMGVKLGSVERLARKGIGAIPVEQGIKRFRQLVENDPGTQQIIVVARLAGLDTWKSQPVKPKQFRFIEKVEYILPGVELIAQAQLNVNDDPYLLDHNWKGSLLFPFVFGFEAMAQAVANVLGIDGFDYIKARDINLERPIPVPQESGTTIEIHALALEIEKKDEPRKVKVEIYSKETGYQEPHFSAVFEVASKLKISEKFDHSLEKRTREVVDLDMQTDIYGPILFQGRMFQSIQQIHELNYDEKIKEGKCLFTSAYNKSANTFLKGQKKFNGYFLVGDPFFIDTMLQSMQLIIPQDICLPRDIEEIELTSFKKKSRSEFIAESEIKRIDSEYYRGDAQSVRDGFLIKIKDCRLKVLDSTPNNPSANDLVNTAKRDQRIIESKVSELSKELGFTPPVIKCLCDERLKEASKDQRHEIELPLIKEAVEELLICNNKPVKDFKVQWFKSGKPVVEGKGVEGVGVSITHMGTLLIIVAGYGEQGCDVEEIQSKGKKEWLEILGKENYELLDKMILNDGELNKKGTIVWSVSESLHKFTNQNFKLNFDTEREEYIGLEADVAGDKKTILAFPVRLTRGGQRIFSFVCSTLMENLRGTTKIRISPEFDYDKDIFRMDVNLKGPEGQIVYAKRFPVTFKNTQTFNKNVYFTNYFNWVGEIREYSLYPIRHELTRLLETGDWGMATNHVKLQIFETLKIDDIIEGRVWAHQISGDKDSVVDLKFDWLKVLSTGRLEMVATTEQRISWIKIIGHGAGRTDYFPPSLKKFFNFMKPKTTPNLDLQPSFRYSSKFNLGERLLTFSKKEFTLIEHIFDTTFEESNLVGNVYFSNYGKWLGKIQDIYLNRVFPNYSENNLKREFFCFNCEVYHVAEAMPFDSIKVVMYLDSLYENGVEFYFEFFKDTIRLAYAKNIIIWGAFEKNKFFAERMPVKFINHFESGSLKQ